jgi:hypothetical protein
MLRLNLILLIDVTFSTPTPDYINLPPITNALNMPLSLSTRIAAAKRMVRRIESVLPNATSGNACSDKL